MPTTTTALFQPPGACRTFTRSGSVYPPLGLCQLAATVSDSDALVIDADGRGWDEDRARAEVLSLSPSAVGLTATSFTLDLVECWASRFAAQGIRIIVGGPHASLEPRDLLGRCPSVEAVVRGEGEVVFPEIVSRLVAGSALSGVPGVVVRGGLDASILQVPDLGAVPFPRLDGLPIGEYWCPDARRRPMVTFMTTRGCPHRCGFCSSPALLGRKVRGAPVAAVLDELERLVHRLGIREVSFVDDVFTINRRRTTDLCHGMVERGLDLSWFCNARADQVTPELAEVMAAAGCHQAYLGFESGDDRVLRSVDKGATVAVLERGARFLADAGVDRSIGFVLGLPGEDEVAVEATIELALRVRPERIQFTRWTALPGSPLAANDRPRDVTFHRGDDEVVERRIQRAYAACSNGEWGKPSW